MALGGIRLYCSPQGQGASRANNKEFRANVSLGFEPTASGAELNGSPSALRRYLNEIARQQLLTKAEERILGGRIASGLAARERLDHEQGLSEAERVELTAAVRDGEMARVRFFEANLRLVVAIARPYARPAIPLEDLIQEGNIGLLKAVERFDHRKGFAFSTYARWWIRQSIESFLATDADLVRLSVRARRNLRNVQGSRERLLRHLGRRPSDEEVAADLGTSVRLVAEVAHYASASTSLDGVVQDTESVSLLERLAAPSDADPEVVTIAHARRSAVADALDQLPPRCRHVLQLRFGFDGTDGHTLTDIGDHLGVTRVRVAQIETRGVTVLRTGSAARTLEGLLGA